MNEIDLYIERLKVRYGRDNSVLDLLQLIEIVHKEQTDQVRRVQTKDNLMRQDAIAPLLAKMSADDQRTFHLNQRSVTECPIVKSVIHDLELRAALGLAKYGVTLARTDLSRLDWLTHAYHECLDQACYLQRLIQLEKDQT